MNCLVETDEVFIRTIEMGGQSNACALNRGQQEETNMSVT